MNKKLLIAICAGVVAVALVLGLGLGLGLRHNQTNSDKTDNTEQAGGTEETDKNEQQKPQIKYTVTKQEWVEALSLFDVEKIAENSSKLNLTASVTNIYNGSATHGYSIDINYSDKMAYLGGDSYESGVKSTVTEQYFWEKDDGSISHCSIENSKKEYDFDYTNDFNNCVEDCLDYAAGIMLEFDDYDKYEYNEENFEYSSYNEEMGMTSVFKFENGKLVNFIVRGEGREYKYEYSYGSSLTIPETILKNQ